MTTFMACLKSVGAGVLTLAILGFLGWYCYSEMIASSVPVKEDVVAAHGAAHAQPNESVTVTAQKKPS